VSGPPPGTAVDPKGASDPAVARANDVLDRVFGHLAKDNRARLGRFHVKLVIIPVSLKLTDLPEYSRLKGQPTFESTPERPRTFDDIRGAGGELNGDTITYAIGEEQFTHIDGHDSGYGDDHVPIHESGHVIHQWGLTDAQHAAVDQLWKDRKADASKTWLAPSDYTSANTGEYFANSVAAFFSASYSTDPAVVATYTPQWLLEHDPGMFRILTQVFADAGAAGPGDYHGLDEVGRAIAALDDGATSKRPVKKLVAAGVLVAAATTGVVLGVSGGGSNSTRREAITGAKPTISEVTTSSVAGTAKVSGTYQGTVTVDKDPAGHSCCVAPTKSWDVLQVRDTSTGAITITLDNVLAGINLTGPLTATGDPFVATGAGTVAGRANTAVSFAGSVTPQNGLHGSLTVGANGTLPTGQPISFEVDMTKVA
jgi:hypothetical protein